MDELVGIVPTTERFLNVTWVTSNLCNFNCSYCSPNNHIGDYTNTSNKHLSNCRRLIDKICSVYPRKGHKKLRIFFSGGEPSYWKPLPQILRYITDTVKRSGFEQLSIGINTNLSSDTTWWKDNWEYFDHMSASFHIESCNQELYLERLKFLQDKFSVTSRMMMLEDRFQEIVDFSDRICSELNNYHVEYIPLLTELSNRGVPIEYKEQWMKDFF
ncbi:MAG: 4Fe-4S cluster-binding domain-containing protein [Bdellovibrionales bacterium]|jgi:organic radical activating enzyme|nr:4Fe-4S cluster-binding domain-containing protein [Bdellovibrionales bacterium]MBT3525371.1 4Fe-4S cluster-binding domain-containing protein [Bdellovibrionales bacterium]MBT7670458.1 4Fe-4S cluster-binding domain-containing protein [Bdellovibrionales bacterium]MBT7766610.1 4Fe-4S cluster-binding domain-containing protein [Bdellovibrionales bacterium]